VTEDSKTKILRIVLDCLKPHQPSTWEVASTLSQVKGITSVDVEVDEVDSETESIKVSIAGNNLSMSLIEETLKDACVAIHSVDRVVAGNDLSASAPLSSKE
jgi:hypothetical protein